MKLRLLLSALLLSIPFLILSQQEYHISVNHYDIEDGLSHNQVHWLHQDSRGMLWIGAANGINRYDGETFKLVAERDFIFLSNHVMEDQEGDLWLRINYWKPELIFFNIYTEQIKTFEEKFKDNPPPFQKEDFMTAALLSGNTIMIGTKDGKLISYDQSKKFKQRHQLDQPIAKIIPIPESKDFWVHEGCLARRCVTEPGSTHTSELYFFKSLQDGQFKKQSEYDISSNKHVVSPYIRPIGVTEENSLLFVDDFFVPDKNLYVYEFQTNGKTKLLDIGLQVNSNVMVNVAYDQGKEEIYLCKDGEVYIYAKQESQFLFKSKTYKSLINSHNNCSLYKDGVMWIGCSPGLAKIQVKANDFKKTAFLEPEFHSSAEFESTRALYPHFPDIMHSTPSYYKTGGHQDDFWVYYTDENNRLWIGDFAGVYYLDEENDKPKYLNAQGVFVDQLKSRVYQFYKDREGQLWVVSADGLFYLDINKGITTRLSASDSLAFLPTNELRHMHQDEEGVYWIGTTEGLVRWNRDNNQHKIYSTKDGLSDNHIMAVYEDDFGFIWMTSDNGLMQFQKSTAHVKVYLPEDGISHREFNRTSHFRDSLGNLYFGSLNGVTHFHPRDFVKKFDEQPDIPLVLTECNLVNGNSNQQESRLASFFETGNIILHPRDHNLQLKFSLLDYVNNNTKLIQYVYNINGEQAWNVGNDNTININTLPYGKHILQIKARAGNGLFSKQTLEIPVTVLRPFYLQWWFIAFSICSVILLFYFFQKMKTRAYLRRQAFLEKTVKERTQTIQQQAEALKELDITKSRFLANISHEFRTPLTLILNTLKSEQIDQLSGYVQQEDQISFGKFEVDIMSRNANRLKQLIDQLLDLAKLESQKMELNESAGDFKFYLRELINSFIPLALQKEIDLQFEARLENQMLCFDRDKIDKIVYNLLSNAMKFTPVGGNISVFLYQDEKYTIIKIQDSGIGISLSDRTKIYDRFYQVNKGNDFAYEGTGLGLALVKELVEVHGGIIELDSVLQKGSTFTVSLPLKKAEATDSQSEFDVLSEKSMVIHDDEFLERPIKYATPQENELPLLLIIEDNEDLLYHHKKSFEQQYQLFLARDGISGLALAFQKIPDIIVCDVMMPGKNGYEVCQQLKSDKRTNHIPIILLTAKAGKDEKINALESGANAYMTKPYSQKELELRLTNLLQQRLHFQKQFQESPSMEAEKVVTPESVFIDKCHKIIEGHINNRNFGVETMSEELSISRTNLFRKIKSITGTTPTHFIRLYRLEKAKKLLMVFAGNATEVSYMVGFNNPNYFFKCFKDQYDITVGQFMESLTTTSSAPKNFE